VEQPEHRSDNIINQMDIDDLFRQAEQSLQHYWGFDSFRPGQDVAIRSVLQGKETLVLFPTGGGKSLCYQIPATVLDGLTLVISPLVALMQDQVSQLNDRGISATFVNSSLTSWEVEQRFVNARNGMYKLFYCAPERLKSHLFQAEMERMNISQVAIDEAHCISEWGHDFRPSYREIRPALEPLSESAAWIALTATATPEVRDDIVSNLGFEEPNIVSKGFERPNLKWWVIEHDQKRQKLLQAVRRASKRGSGLIYGGTRRNCEQLAQAIGQQLGIAAKAYHAGVEDEQRKAIQEEWISGELPLVVATSAFGMGIDKADCRYVIHYELPYSLEAYYQEAGRAGRDGRESYPILMFRESDAVKAGKRLKESYPGKADLQKLYDALCDELGLAIGSEMDSAEQVSIDALVKRSRLPKRIVSASLKVLNQLGIIQLIEHVVPQIALQFSVSRDYIRDLIDGMDNKEKAAFLDTIFRQFGHEAFAEMKYLELDYLQRKLDTTRNGVIKGLRVLQDHDHILGFREIGEMPLVRLLDERVSGLPLGKSELERHRESLLRKLNHMVGYIKTDGCREKYIRTYFGDEEAPPCGHCDNCLETGNGDQFTVTNREIQILKELLVEEARDIAEIRRHTKWGKEQVRRSLSFLIREERVEPVDGKYVWKE